MFANSKFFQYAYKEDYEQDGYELYDLVNKYGLRHVMDKWLEWKKFVEVQQDG